MSLLLLFLFGSTEIEGELQRMTGSAIGRKGTVHIGQTFFSRYDNLHRIEVMFSTFRGNSHEVTFYLKEFTHPLELCGPLPQRRQIGTLVYDLYQGKRIGQTFTSYCPGLRAIRVPILFPQLPHDGKIIFHLKSNSETETDIVKIVRDVSETKSNTEHDFEFAPIHNSQGKSYYFLLETEGIPPEYALKMPSTPDDTYEEGKGYVDDLPVAGDLIFKEEYWSLLEEKEPLVQVDMVIPKGSKDYVSFRFPPVKHSKGKYYYFFLEFQSNALAPWEVESDLYQDGSKIIDHAPVKGDLTFRVLYKTNVARACSLLLERVSANKSGVFSRRFFYSVVFLGYLLIFMLFLWQLPYGADKRRE